MNILVYSGDGASRASIAHTVNSLRSLIGQHYDVMKIDASGLLTEPWEESTSLLVFPGGRDLPYVRDLNGAVNTKIKDYVHSGGKFLGICAGAYYGSDRINFEIGSMLEVQGSRDLKFYPGECRGAVYPGFVYESETGARAARIRVNESIFSQDNLGFTDTKVYFNGGGYFVDAERQPATQVLAWYSNEHPQIISENTTPKAAIIECQVSKGLAILSGVHPEYDATNMDSMHPEYGPQPNLVNYLAEKEHERRALLRSVLRRFGLNGTHPQPSNPSTYLSFGAIQGVSPITPLYLASITPSYTDELSRILASLANKENIIQEPNDSFQLVMSPQHHVPIHTPTITETEDGDTEEYITKNIVICPDNPPTINLTPEFDMSRYFADLKKARQNIDFSDFNFGNSLMYGHVVTSTQTMLDKNFNLCQQLPDGFVCSATIQVAGRGRGRNSWISPPGCLQFSMVLRHPLSASHAPAVFVQYLVALAVVEGVCSLPGYEDIPLRLKWPNDIYAEAPLEHPSQMYASSTVGPDGQYQYTPKMVKIGGVLVNSNFNGSEFLLVIVTLTTISPNKRVRIKGVTPDYGLLRTVAVDDQGRDVPSEEYRLQPDGNSFDMLKGLISQKK
ncbi:biotin holocarboxylase synthetase [Entomortierella beljakovae]|nr:biotin holocarboxylase synthetase [Entomortierella beljakovae]